MDITKLGSDKVQDQRTQTTSTEKSKATQKAQQATDAFAQKEIDKAKSSSSEKVKWSPDAQLMAESLEVARKTPDVRADKVAALKKAISEGTYKVDAKSVADKMISTSLENDLLTRNV